ncbi:IST1 homolog [Hydractinia symbiolongicarpus]|uniref:IST1 homolog n=1 Tax=Hydractinia symbiolongicarpus TaxID=13093 RepID=UPI00254DD840|nr:IST1 homolog [Hydractinia symbiolongicarpus]
MFSGGFRGQKLKTSLRLSINRLKLMEKKKTEMALKARKEISDFIQANKFDRARIRVEHIIREDYLVEAMELIEMYCDLLLARFGLIESMKYCDEGLVEAVSTIIWAAPRLSADCQELRTVTEQLTFKYGKEFGQQARSNTNNTVNERLIHKLSPDPPPKILVERYLIEIARNYNVPFEPDPDVMMSEGVPSIDSKEFEGIGGPQLAQPPGIGFNHFNDDFGPPPPGGNSGNSGFSGGGSFGGGSNFSGGGGSNFGGGGGSNFGGGGDLAYPPPQSQRMAPPYPTNDSKPYPMDPNDAVPRYTAGPGMNTSASAGASIGKPTAPPSGMSSIPNLPDIPTGSLSHGQPSVGGQSTGGDVDFDDLTRRFEELKKKK